MGSPTGNGCGKRGSAWRSGPGQGGSSTVRRYGSSAVQESARGAELAARLRGTLFTVTEVDFDCLREACVHHTEGLLDAEVTVQTCWDADRLDLPRVGIAVDPARLCTASARDPAILAWAGRRSRATGPALGEGGVDEGR
jgi:hypothetical protein